MKKNSILKTLFQRIAFLTMIFASTLNAKDIYVAKTGNDSNPGTAAQPFKTIAKASSIAQAGDVIIIGEGTYEETIKPARSGVAGRPITYIAKQGDKVIISAMQALSGWQKDRGAIYKTKVNWDLGQENFVMNGNNAMDLARWPNNTDGDVFTLNSKRNDGGSGANVVNGAYLTSSQIPNINWKGGSVFFYGDKPGSGWIAWKAFITSSTAGRVNFTLDKNPSWIRTFHAPADKGDFYLEGVKGALDYQNEWWFDSSTKELFVQIPNGGAPANGVISMRRRTVTVDLAGRSYIHIKNLAVFGGSINMPNNTGNNLIYGVSSFYGNHTLGVQKGFSANKQSILLEGNNNVVEKCEVAFGAANGIKVSGNNNKILNSRIHDFNYIGSYDAPINARGGRNTTFKGNTIFRAGRDGVQFFNNSSEFAYNDVYRANLINDDCALIYTVGGPHNGEIHHNWFHDNESRGRLRKAAAIYLDNDAEAFSVHHNVVWNIEWTGVQINWNGKDIDIFNNTLVKTQGGAMGAWHKAGTAFSNVKVWNNIADVETVDDPTTQEDEGTFERDADKQNNVITKSGFLNYNNNKFNLTAGSPAVNAGRQISGITNGYVGAAPDAGAYEYGGENWVPGIDWNPNLGPTGQGCYGLPGESCTVEPSKPVVSFSTPANNAQFDPGSSIEVEVNATDADGTIAYVELFINDEFVRRENLAPYEWGKATQNDPKLKNLAVGDYTLKAVAYDNDGKNSETTINVKVSNSDPQYGDKVNFVNAPTTIAPSTTYTFDVNYEASADREIVVEFWSATNWIAQENIIVSKGTGVKPITVNLPNPPQPGTGYVYKLHIRPVGTNWQNAIDRDQVNNVTVQQPYADKVSFSGASASIVQANSYTFNINYEASANREIVVEFWSATSWIAQADVTVSQGTGVKPVTVNLPNLPNPGNGYIYKTHIRPVGTTWRDALDTDQVSGVVVNSLNTQIIPDGTYFITSSVNDQRLLSRALENHSAVMINPGNYDDQKWEFKHLSDDVYTIKNIGTGRYLEVPYAACGDGTNVATWLNAADAHKQWKVVQNGTGIYGLKPMHCLSTGLDRAAGAQNANVQIWGYSSSNTNQKWKIIEDHTSSKAATTREIASLSDDLFIYPNPVVEVLHIKNQNAKAEITIFDMLGRKILSRVTNEKNESTSINVSILNDGLYFLTVNGGEPIKFMKE